MSSLCIFFGGAFMGAFVTLLTMTFAFCFAFCAGRTEREDKDDEDVQ